MKGAGLVRALPWVLGGEPLGAQWWVHCCKSLAVVHTAVRTLECTIGKSSWLLASWCST